MLTLPSFSDCASLTLTLFADVAMAFPIRGWLVLIVLIFGAVSPAASQPKRVLLLHSFGPQFAPFVQIAAHFRDEIFRQSPDQIDLYEASLDGARFQEPDEQGALGDYLSTLFRSKKIDVIVTIGAPAAIFIQKYRAQFFPSTPAVIGGSDSRVINYATLTPNDAPVVVTNDFNKWIENILQVVPDTKHIVWIIGNSPLEKFWAEQFRRASQPYSDRVSFEWLNELPFGEMVKRISILPPHSAVFFAAIFVDGAGVPQDRETVFPKLRAATNAPIFSQLDNYLGQGIVGGPMISIKEVGRRMAEATVRILRGEVPANLKIPSLALGAPQYDWRELQHWKISEGQLPAGSIVLFREPPAWKQYVWQIALICAVILAQGALIYGLLFQRRRRLYAEVQARQRSIELAHVNRLATAGELTATIAHELNQPLGAILTNVETVQLMVKSPVPDLQEVEEILADIRRDDMRASEVIGRLRALLKKTPLELKQIDFNDVVQNTVQLLLALAVGRGVHVTSLVAPTPLSIKGDEIQLQQVILNLIVNAMDAMAALPVADRRITVSTARDGNAACLAVSDVGPGIPNEKLKDVFEPFFTTKAEGMGVGLSIARTIVEAHGGQLSAENEAGRGATFRIRLPLAGS